MKSLPVFSTKNTVPLSKVLLVHLTFLTIILVGFKCISYIMFYFPDWLTDETIRFRGGAFSGLELMVIVSMMIMHIIERKWIYVEAETDVSEKDNSMSES